MVSTGKAKKIHVVIRDIFVLNRDNKKHDSRQKNHESCFCFVVRNGPKLLLLLLMLLLFLVVVLLFLVVVVVVMVVVVMVMVMWS